VSFAVISLRVASQSVFIDVYFVIDSVRKLLDTPQEKEPWYPLARRMGGLQSRSGRDGEKKNSQPPPGIEP
jgi:hypothetical protein